MTAWYEQTNLIKEYVHKRIDNIAFIHTLSFRDIHEYEDKEIRNSHAIQMHIYAFDGRTKKLNLPVNHGWGTDTIIKTVGKIQIRNIHKDHSPTENIGDIVNYINKHEQQTTTIN